MPVPPAIPEHSEAPTPSDESPPYSSPIHSFIPAPSSKVRSMPNVRIGDILHWAADTIMSNLPKNVDSTSSAPSHHPQRRGYQVQQFNSPDMYLTQALLDTELVIGDTLSFALTGLQREAKPTSYDENTFTQELVRPLMRVLLALFEEMARPGVPGQWRPSALNPVRQSQENGEEAFNMELDATIYWDAAPLPAGVPAALEALISTIEMKTPRACNTTPIRTLATSTLDAPRDIRDQIGKQGALLKKIHLRKNFVVHALSIVPAHLIPLASNGTDTFAIGSDLLKIEDSFPFVVKKTESWLEYIDKLGAFILFILCQHDNEIACAVAKHAEEQCEQVNGFLVAAGEALKPTLFKTLLTALWAGIFWLQRGLSAPLLLILIHFNWLSPINMLKQRRRVDSIVLNTNFFPLLPFGLALPCPSAVHETAENIVYVYSEWCTRLVIKLFTNEKTFANELACYHTLASLQGAGIPRLLSTGISRGQPCLVLSYEGEQQRHELSDTERASLDPIVTAIHENGIHHHDLHARNVVWDSGGKASIIDFGYAGPCDNPSCKDEWKPIWAN